MIRDILDKTRSQSSSLRRKTAPSRFLDKSTEIENTYRKPLSVASSAGILSLKDRVYSTPVAGYLTKLLLSIVKLPVRLGQLYDHLAALQAQSNQLQNQLHEIDQKVQEKYRELREKTEEIGCQTAILQELNHTATIQHESFRSESIEKLTRVRESMSAFDAKIALLQTSSSSSHASTENHPIDSAFYAAFERRFRSPTVRFQSHFKTYFPFVNPDGKVAEQKVLDLGCGRGEWLRMLREQGFQVSGVDINATTNSLINDKEIEIFEADALGFMAKQHTGTYNVVSSFHLVEHLEPGYLVSLIQQAFRILKPGGLLILETPNPENIVVGACNFYMDPTHKRPIPPPALAFMVEYSGFESIECLRFEPGLTDYAGSDEHLKNMSYYFSVGQDYAIVARKPNEPKDHL